MQRRADKPHVTEEPFDDEPMHLQPCAWCSKPMTYLSSSRIGMGQQVWDKWACSCGPDQVTRRRDG